MRYVLAGLLVLAVVMPDTAAASTKCVRNGTRTLDRSADVRVYETKRGIVVACSRSTGRRVRLGHSDPPGWPSERVARVVALDRRVVFILEYEARGSEEQLVVIDVRRRKTLLRETVATVDDRGHGDRVERLLDLEAGERAIALTVEREIYDYTTHQVEIEREILLTTAHDYRLSTLDRAPDIEPGSLALSARWVYWTRGGVPRRGSIS